MPSSPGSTDRQPTLPWFLDPLRWIGAVAEARDRRAIAMVRADLAEDLHELLEAGVPRWRAYRAVLRRAKLECAFFLPRVGRHWQARASRAMRHPRRLVRPAISVAALCLVLLSAKWFFLDRTKLKDWTEVSRQIVEMTKELQGVQDRLGQLGRPTVDISQETRDLIGRLEQIQDYFERVRRDHPEEFYLTGWIGLVDEALATFWAARGDDAKSELHWRAALDSYARGARERDPISSYRLGIWYVKQKDLHGALPYLREAHHQWFRLTAPAGSTTGHVAADYHWALFELWRAERLPVFAAEARELEEEALRDVQNGTTKETTYRLLYNAACLRTLMIRAGAVDPIETGQVINLLHTVLAVARESAARIAQVMLTDTDLDDLRALPAFEGVASKAKAIVAANSPGNGR